MARMILGGSANHGTEDQHATLTWGFAVERVTGIEPALSAWEAVPSWLLHGLSCKEACP